MQRTMKTLPTRTLPTRTLPARTLFAQVTDPAPSQPRAGQGPDRPLAKVFVRDLVLNALVGIYDREKTARQRVRVNLDLQVLDRVGPKRDAIDDVVSYEDAVNTVKAVVGAGHVNLLETLAEDIADSLLSDPRIRTATVRLEKLDAFAECAAVGIEIVRGQG